MTGRPRLVTHRALTMIKLSLVVLFAMSIATLAVAASALPLPEGPRTISVAALE